MQIESVLQTKNRSEPAKNLFSVALLPTPTVLCLSPYSILMTFFPALGYLIIPTHPFCTGLTLSYSILPDP